MKTEQEYKDKFLNLETLYCSLVGNLYPSIVYNEIVELYNEYKSLYPNGKELSIPTPPNDYGYVK
jgi:hypothetical protein